MVHKESCNSVSVLCWSLIKKLIHVSAPVYSGNDIWISLLLYWKSYVTSDPKIINTYRILIYDLRYNGVMQMNRTCMSGDLKKNMLHDRGRITVPYP